MGDVSRSSITLSSASYASSLFPAVDEDAAALIEAILERVSPGEAEWKPFLQAYDTVFRERGLDKQSDTVIYDLILKLGIQSGKNWRAKWENVKKAQLQQEQQEATRVDRQPGNAIWTPINKTRAASTYAIPNKARSYDHQTDGQSRLTREALDQLQESTSPFKPLRTPHPQNVNARDVRPGTTPRVRFEADLQSQRHARAPSDVFRTPDAAKSSGEQQDRDVMVRQAEQFDRLSLLGRVYDDWLARFFVLKRLDMHASLARDALLKRRSLTFWAERIHRHEDLEQRAELTHEAMLKRSSFELWKQKRSDKQRKVWEKAMTVAFRAISKKRDTQSEEAAFNAWRRATLDSKSAKFRRATLLRATLSKWLSTSARLAEISAEAEAVHEAREGSLISRAFATWKMNAFLSLRESEVNDFRNANLLSSIFKTWRQQAQVHELAREQYQHSIQQRALKRWRYRLQYNGTLREQALSLSHARDEDAMERAFHTWKIREHARLLERAKGLRVVRSAMQRWRDTHRKVTITLELEAENFRQQTATLTLRACLTSWSLQVNQHQKAQRLAGALHDRLQIHRAFAQWRSGMAEQRLATRKAVIARDFFLQRGAVRVWFKRVRWIRANKAIAEKEQLQKRLVLRAWHEKARKSQRFAILEEGIHSAIDQRVLTTALRDWTTKVIELRSRALNVSSQRDVNIARGALVRWINKARQNTENISLVDSFIDVKEEEHLRSSFRKWLVGMRRNRLLRSKLEQKLRDDQDNLVLGAFDRWVDCFREKELVEQEEQVLRYRTAEALKATFRRWKERTLTLPAIRFDALRLRSMAMRIWRERLPEQADLNLAIHFDQDRLLHATVLIWHEGSLVKAARRATNRFRVFSARPGRSVNLNRAHGESVTPTRAVLAVPPSSTRRAEHSPVEPIERRLRVASSASPAPYSSARGRKSSNLVPPSSVPQLYSASQLRRELAPDRVSTPTALARRAGLADLSPAQSRGYSREERSLQGRAPTGQGFDTNTSKRLQPEQVALPPSSSATAQTSPASTSPATRVTRPLPDVVAPPAQNVGGAGPAQDRERRVKSRSRDAFEEGVLQEMRERLAAVGFGAGVRSRNLAAGALAVNQERSGDVEVDTRSNSGIQSRSRSRSRGRSVLEGR